MVTLRRPSRGTGGAPPDRSGAGGAPPGFAGRRRRWVGIFTVTTAVTACALIACALFAPVTVFGAQASTAGSFGGPLKLSSGVLLTTLPWGTGAGQVGLEQPSEGLTRGPEALAVSPDGRIAVLDSVNRRVVFLDSGGQQTRCAQLLLSEPRFIAVTDSCVYVLDCDESRSVEKLDWAGTSCGRMMLPALPDVVTGLFATLSGPCVEIAHDQVYLLTNGSAQTGNSSGAWCIARLTSEPGRPLDQTLTRLANVAFAPGSELELASFVNTGGTTTNKVTDLNMAVPADRTIENLVSVDGDVNGGVVIGAGLMDADASQQQAVLLLRRFVLAGDGTMVPASQSGGGSDSFALVDWSSAYVGQPYVVAPDGRVFQPVCHLRALVRCVPGDHAGGGGVT